jgi:hypothetical protein
MWMKEFLFSGVCQLVDTWSKLHDSKIKKEARMNNQVNYIFWKQGPLLLSLFDMGQVKDRKSIENET